MSLGPFITDFAFLGVKLAAGRTDGVVVVDGLGRDVGCVLLTDFILKKERARASAKLPGWMLALGYDGCLAAADAMIAQGVPSFPSALSHR